MEPPKFLHIVELNHSLSARNVQNISKEFNKPFIMVGAGKEYLVQDEIDPQTSFILPLNYPKALDVKDPIRSALWFL